MSEITKQEVMEEAVEAPVAEQPENGKKKIALKLPKFKRADLSTRKANQGWFFVLPFVLGLLAIYLPIVLDSIWFSFNTITQKLDTATNQVITVVTPEGFKYYQDALLANTGFLENLWSGVQELILNVPAIVIFSLFIAVILNQKMIGRAAFRAIFFIPVILATGMMETIEAMDVLNDSIESTVNPGEEEMMGFMGMFDAATLLSTMKVGGELVTYVMSLVTRVYQLINDSGVQMLIFLAGLQSISPSIYEACEIEGATAWETFWKITIPMISPMILVNAIYTVIDSFTKGSNIVMTYIDGVYNAPNRHLATAMSWIYFLVVLLIVGICAGVMSAFVFYQKRD